MSQFQVFTYQFRVFQREPGEQTSLFDPSSNVSHEELMKRKQDLFEQMWKDEEEWKFMYKGKEYVHKVLEHKDHIIVLRIANNRKIRKEENFKIVELDHRPSCMVIIDNRHDRQQIAIQRNSAFSKQTRVAEIMQEAFRERMKRHRLVVDINARYEVREFWKLIERNPQGMKTLKFTFSPKNLPWLAGNVKKIFNDMSDEFNGQASMEMNAMDKVPLAIDPDSPVLKEFLDISSASGMPIIIRFFNTRSAVICGKETCIIISLDKRVMDKIDATRLIANDEIPEKTWESIIEFVNENKILNN